MTLLICDRGAFECITNDWSVQWSIQAIDRLLQTYISKRVKYFENWRNAQLEDWHIMRFLQVRTSHSEAIQILGSNSDLHFFCNTFVKTFSDHCSAIECGIPLNQWLTLLDCWARDLIPAPMIMRLPPHWLRYNLWQINNEFNQL